MFDKITDTASLNKTMKMLIQTLSVLSAAFTLVGAEPTKPPLLEIRSVRAGAGLDTEQMTFSHPAKSEDPNLHEIQEVVHLDKTSLLDQTSVRSAAVETNLLTRAPEIMVTLTANGRKLFAEVTRQNVGKRIAIVVEGKLLSIPQIAGEISGGNFSIPAKLPAENLKEIVAKINNAAKK